MGTSSHIPDVAKMEISGCVKGLKSLREGRYFPVQLMDILLLQNTWLHEEKPPQGLLFFDWLLITFNKLFRCHLLQRTMWTERVVFLHPGIDLFISVLQRQEPVRV